jgi:hypothetical protein
MKKVKIMLLSLAVLAVVGGALAFKAKNFSQLYCIGTTDQLINPNGTCAQTEAIVSKFGATSPVFLYTTLQADGASPITQAADCAGELNCKQTSLKAGEN